MKLSKAPCVVHHHVVTDIINEPSIKGCEIVDKADRICFVSDFARDFAKTGTDEQNKKMQTFPNAVDIKRFEQLDTAKAKTEIREKYVIKKDDKVIVFIGRLVRYKGAIELIKAFNNAGFSDDVKLMIVGGETYASTKVTPYVQECLDEAKDNKNIILTGYVPYEDIPKYYYASDISTLLSFVNEAAGLVGIESMAAGLPLITTDRGGIQNYIPKEAKIKIEEGEDFIERLTEAIKLLVSDEDMRNKMSICAKNESKKYDRKSYYNSFCKLVEQVTE
jgi:glycosyltransferase involved in cell wall biosynthesis